MSTSFYTSDNNYSSNQSDSFNQSDNTTTYSNYQDNSSEKQSYDVPDISDRSEVEVSWNELYYGGTTVDDALF